MNQNKSKFERKSSRVKATASTFVKILFLLLIIFTIFEVRERTFLGVILAFAILLGIVIGFISRVTSAGLRGIKSKQNQNQNMEPIVTTPVDKVEAQSTQAHV
jgi:ABC-type bacteriocin/lantibiotic exporter with double-glycine peptidase domain